MRLIKNMKYPLTILSSLSILLFACSHAWGQDGNGSSENDSKPRSALSVKAANWGSVDRWMFTIQGECWATDANSDDGTLGAAGATTFMVRQGSREVLQVTPLDAIDADDGTVSGRYTVCSDEVMFIDGALEPCDDPILVEAGNIPERSFDVVVPHVTGIQLQRGDDWEETPVEALDYVCQGATLTFRAVVEPAGGCTVVWKDEDGGELGTGEELSHAFSAPQTIFAGCQEASAVESVSVAVLENSPLPENNVSLEEIAECSQEIDRCTLGYVCKEHIEISVSACLGSGNWQPIMTDVVGHYVRHVSFPPEIQDVTGNTAQENFCHQIRDLRDPHCPAVGDMGHWYSLAAVNAHEDVHVGDLLPALQQTVKFPCESNTEKIRISDVFGRSQAQAIEKIKTELSVTEVDNACQEQWYSYVNINGECPSMQAEINTINPMLGAICATALTNWPETWENCLECRLDPLQVPVCE